MFTLIAHLFILADKFQN